MQINGVGMYLNLEQKQEFIRQVRDAVVAVAGKGLRPVTWIIVEDVEPGAWRVGGAHGHHGGFAEDGSPRFVLQDKVLIVACRQVTFLRGGMSHEI